jgi:oligopeptidase A
VQNPLLALKQQSNHLPSFSDIHPEHAAPALDQLLAHNRSRIAELLASGQPYTWETLSDPIEQLDNNLGKMWSIVSHLHAVMNTTAWRDVYHACLPKLSEYSTEMGQHEGLYQAYQSIAQSPEYEHLDIAQKKTIEHQLRDFRLSGVHLKQAEKQRYGEIQKELTSLSAHFENNVMDATQAWNKLITDNSLLAGLPEHTVEAARIAAEKQEKTGWLLTLDYPCYDAVMTYADQRELREEMYTAYVTRASDQGPHAGRWNNNKLIETIVALRQELAELLGFPTYAELSLVTKMAKNTEQVIDFLMDLAQRSHTHAQLEWNELTGFAQQLGLNTPLQAWDIGYYSEKLMQQRYQIIDEDIRPYFPMDQALSGLFQTVERLYQIHITERTDVNTWHPDVRFFEIFDSVDNNGTQKTLRGQFYLDPYARPHKRDGAWMDDYQQRYKMPDGTIQIPIAYLVCNFRPASADKPALLSHDEVITLFHEFGHGLQHLLTRIDYLSVAGMHGVAWDAVELPSQFMENWCWQEEALKFLSRHYITGKPLPHEWLQNMLAAKNFHSGLHINRQLLFALFDMRLHSEAISAQDLLNQLRSTLFVAPTPSFNHFQNSFTHVFGGGYAAGYYSYLWAEVLSCDAFSAFEENGIFDKKTGQAFLHTILEQGGSREPLDLFIEFRGREPNIQALLKHSGLL